MLPIILLLTDKAVSRQEAGHTYVRGAKRMSVPMGPALS